MWTDKIDFYVLVNLKKGGFVGEMLSNDRGIPILFTYFDEANSYIDEQMMWGEVEIRPIHFEFEVIK